MPDLTDLSKEPDHVLEAYGPDVRKPGSYAFNCLLARRLAERDVRFVQLYHMGWDQHGNLPKQIRGQCHDTDQPSAALVQDLKQRGLLDDTLVIWGGEFGRTVYCQGELTATNYGRDHHPALLHRLAGRRRHQGRPHPRRDRRLLVQHRPRPGGRVRPERHDPAPARHRPHPPDLPLPGPRLPPDRRPRHGGEGHSRLTRRRRSEQADDRRGSGRY